MEGVASEPWRDFSDQVHELRKAVDRFRGERLGSAEFLTDARAVAQQYFRFTRPELVRLGFTGPDLAHLDNEMRALLRLASTRSRRSAYGRLLASVVNRLHPVEAAREMRLGEHMAAAAAETMPIVTEIEAETIRTLERLIPTAALAYRQALLDLSRKDRLSYRGTADELREVLRETLDHLAPDEDVTTSRGFKYEKNQTTPTQRQKVRYILRSRGLSAAETRPAEDATTLVEELTGSLARSTYTRGSVASHVGAARHEAQQIKMYVETVLADLLEIHRTMDESR
jgi:Predicted pPIWI-associating nuclease